MFRNIFIKLLPVVLLVSCLYPAVQLTAQDSPVSQQAYKFFRDGLLNSRQGRYTEAIDLLKKAARIDTSSIILKTLGEVYIRPTVKEYGLAAAVFDKYLEKNPFDDRIININLQIYGSTGRLERAQNVLSRAILAGNRKTEYYVTLIDLYLKDKKPQDAFNASLLYFDWTGYSGESCQQVAELFISNSMLLEGLDEYEAYLKQNPDMTNIGIVTGILTETREDFSAAEKMYLNVLEKNETESVARARLAAIYIGASNYDSALQLYENINFDDPSEIPVKLQISQSLLQLNDAPYERIIDILGSVKHKFGATAQVFYLLGLAHSSVQEWEKSEEAFKTSVKLEPGFFLAYYYLASSHYEQEEFNEALVAIDRSLKIRPDFKDGYVLKGICHDRLNQIEETIAAYETGLSITTNFSNNDPDPTLYNNLSYVLAKNGRDLDRALDMVQKALLAEPENSSFLDTIGWVYFKKGKYEEALKYIEKSLAVDPTSAEVLEHLGDVYEKLNQTDKAKEFWQKALDQDESNTEVQKKLNKYK